MLARIYKINNGHGDYLLTMPIELQHMMSRRLTTRRAEKRINHLFNERDEFSIRLHWTATGKHVKKFRVRVQEGALILS